MFANEIESGSSGGSLLSTSQSKALNKDDFLNLLITQLQNQDPLNPTDSTEFTAQLAQFSSLEQLGNVNDNLTELKNFQASINNSQAVTLIDKEITAKVNSIYLDDERKVPCHFNLDKDAAKVVLTIYDHTGGYITEINYENLSAGRQSLTWHGEDQDGNPMAAGHYLFEILASDVNGQRVNSTNYFSGTVDKVSFENNTSYLLVKNQKIALGDVIEVALPEKAKDAHNGVAATAVTESQLSAPKSNGGK